MDRNMLGALGVIAFGVVLIIISLGVPVGEARTDITYLGDVVGGLGVIFLFFGWINSK